MRGPALPDAKTKALKLSATKWQAFFLDKVTACF